MNLLDFFNTIEDHPWNFDLEDIKANFLYEEREYFNQKHRGYRKAKRI